MPDKKLSYVRQKLLHNGDSCPVKSFKKYISFERLKTQKHLVSIGLAFSGFTFYEHFNKQFTYAVFFIFKTIK